MTDSDAANTNETTLGTIGETTIKIVAEGPKATWAADILEHRFAASFVAIKNEAERLDNDD